MIGSMYYVLDTRSWHLPGLTNFLECENRKQIEKIKKNFQKIVDCDHFHKSRISRTQSYWTSGYDAVRGYDPLLLTKM